MAGMDDNYRHQLCEKSVIYGIQASFDKVHGIDRSLTVQTTGAQWKIVKAFLQHDFNTSSDLVG